MPVQIVKRDGETVALYSFCMAHQVRDRIRNEAFDLQYAPAERTFWFRVTNNKTEHKICDKVISKNHANGESECGMSVAENPGYQMMGYKYIYPVTGDVAGIGSDGEPVLINAKALDIPREALNEKWVKANKNLSKRPEWLTDSFISSIKTVYGSVASGEEVLFTA